MPRSLDRANTRGARVVHRDVLIAPHFPLGEAAAYSCVSIQGLRERGQFLNLDRAWRHLSRSVLRFVQIHRLVLVLIDWVASDLLRWCCALVASFHCALY